MTQLTIYMYINILYITVLYLYIIAEYKLDFKFKIYLISNQV